MQNWIRAFWTKPFRAASPPTDLRTLQDECERILRIDLSSQASWDEHGEFAMGVLRRFDAEIEKVRFEANGYPDGSISGPTWMSGVGLADRACSLASHFHGAGWFEHEESACALWVKATLAVCSHYPHMAGPAMVAHADCLERLGKESQADGMYESVVRGFAHLAGEWTDDGEDFPDADRIALESLRTSLQRLQAHGRRVLDDLDLEALRNQVQAILG